MPAAAFHPTLALAPLDWGVLLAYFAALAAVGWAASRRATREGDFFLAGRRMPVWAVALSVLATATSAATFIGGPEEAYTGNLTYLSTNIGTALAVVVVAAVFIPAFYRHNVTTVYDLLAIRFGPAARTAASAAFMGGRVLASGSRVFVAALPVSMILWGDTSAWHMVAGIAVLTAAGILTACFGGIRTVIWTDVMQVLVFVGAAVAAVAVLLHRIPLSPGEIVDVLRATPVGGASKLTALKVGLDPGAPGLGFDPSEVYTLLTAVFGFSLLGTAAYGTDHDLTQRMLTCRSAVRGGASAFLALALNLPMIAVFMSIGLLLFIFYQRPDLMGAAAPAIVPAESRDVFLTFIVNEMPAGLRGLLMAAVFAVGVGSLNSALGAMSATLVNDFYKRARPGMDRRHYGRVGTLGVVLWGLILAGFACVCAAYYSEAGLGTLIRFVLSVMNFAYAGLLGVFCTALLTRRGNAASAVSALVAGFIVILALYRPVYDLWSPRVGLGEFRLAFPWHLLIGTTAAFLVCVAGRPAGGPPRPAGASP
ncbi:MAG: sodium:solute symporter [Phycisphaerales bacterium]|nr:sodium:solute symporter [Phycisphaerales bacterium]